MKKLFSRTALAVTLAMTMIAAPMTALAANAGIGVSASAAQAKTGDTVTFTVTVDADEYLAGVSGTVSASEGLELTGTSVSFIDGALANRVDGSKFIVAADTATAQAAQVSSAVITYTYKVTATSGSVTFSANLNEANNADNESCTLTSTSGTATVEITAAGQPDNPSTPDNPDTPSNPSNPSNPSGSNTTKPANKDLDDVPKTGDVTSNMMVYMVVAIAAAGAIAVVSAKKLAR